MRTPGAKNKPKFMVTTVEELNKIFKPEAKIRIDINYLPLFSESGEGEIAEVTTESPTEPVEATPEPKIEIRRISFNQ